MTNTQSNHDANKIPGLNPAPAQQAQSGDKTNQPKPAEKPPQQK